ncbi:hypothetical protein BLX87_05735 [Bacillus sp. VT-16-64]|nr:hypothetical protein BLX87_05735 [Bacillus sp. VT-16-64]
MSGSSRLAGAFCRYSSPFFDMLMLCNRRESEFYLLLLSNIHKNVSRMSSFSWKHSFVFEKNDLLLKKGKSLGHLEYMLKNDL